MARTYDHLTESGGSESRSQSAMGEESETLIKAVLQDLRVEAEWIDPNGRYSGVDGRVYYLLLSIPLRGHHEVMDLGFDTHGGLRSNSSAAGRSWLRAQQDNGPQTVSSAWGTPGRTAAFEPLIASRCIGRCTAGYATAWLCLGDRPIHRRRGASQAHDRCAGSARKGDGALPTLPAEKSSAKWSSPPTRWIASSSVS